MQGGFTFCGTDIAKLGIYYAPEIENTFVYGNSDLSPHEETFAAHKGGLYYGTTVQPKTFELRCFFEEKNIQQGILDRVLNFFYPGRTGKLIFDTRDWLWYVATVVGVEISQLTNYLNGIITIRLKAYYPFARTDIWCKDVVEGVATYYDKDFNLIQVADPNVEYVADFLQVSRMPEKSFTNISAPKSLILYNAGNQTASVAIKLSGKAGTNGVLIRNINTNQKAHFVAFNRTTTTSQGKYVVTDSLNGKTVLTNGVETDMMMLYHDYGFIELAPSIAVAEDVTFTYRDNDKVVDADTEMPLSAIGKYVYIDGKWRQIMSFYSEVPDRMLIDYITIRFSDESGESAYDDHIYTYSDSDIERILADHIYQYDSGYDRTKLILDSKPSEDGEVVGNVVSMNSIEIIVDENDAEIDEIEFIYKHTFR